MRRKFFDGARKDNVYPSKQLHQQIYVLTSAASLWRSWINFTGAIPGTPSRPSRRLITTRPSVGTGFLLDPHPELSAVSTVDVRSCRSVA